MSDTFLYVLLFHGVFCAAFVEFSASFYWEIVEQTPKAWSRLRCLLFSLSIAPYFLVLGGTAVSLAALYDRIFKRNS